MVTTTTTALPRTAAAGRPIRHHRRACAAGLRRRRRSARQSRAAQGPSRRGERHRRRRRPRPHGGASRRLHPDRHGHRADPADHLPGQKPHRLAERDDGRRRARHPQPAAPHRRRPEGRRPARHQAGVRHQFGDADRDRASAARPGQLPTGRKVAGKASFFIGAADMPIDPPAGWQPTSLLGKIKSGAQFAQTQFCMDPALLRRYVGALEAAGITKQLAHP